MSGETFYGNGTVEARVLSAGRINSRWYFEEFEGFSMLPTKTRL
jgi:hypothetical protein